MFVLRMSAVFYTYFLGISAACLLNYSTDRLEIKIIFFFKIFTHSAFT